MFSVFTVITVDAVSSGICSSSESTSDSRLAPGRLLHICVSFCHTTSMCTHAMLANTSPIWHWFTQSTVHSVLSNSSSDGSGGSSAA